MVRIHVQPLWRRANRTGLEPCASGGNSPDRLQDIGHTCSVHWVLQRGVLRENNLNKLIAALERRGSPFDVITVDTTGQLVPEVSPDGPVMVSGATRMATIAAARGWSPGSFLNENFRFDLWLAELGSDLLNSDATVCRLGEVQITAPRFLSLIHISEPTRPY